jgi:RNAse (barnase) inhibitor barstar
MDMSLKSLRTNIVQSIRAFRVSDLQASAQHLNHHFLYCNLAVAQSKQDVLDKIAEDFVLPSQSAKGLDSLYDLLTDPVHKSGAQIGFIVVLEHIPANAKFDKETREQLLDVFRDIAEYWGDKKIPFRCFYSHSVARAANADWAEQTGASSADAGGGAANGVTEDGEKMPTDKLVDVSPLALRMSSPFNPDYWLTAA